MAKCESARTYHRLLESQGQREELDQGHFRDDADKMIAQIPWILVHQSSFNAVIIQAYKGRYYTLYF